MPLDLCRGGGAPHVLQDHAQHIMWQGRWQQWWWGIPIICYRNAIICYQVTFLLHLAAFFSINAQITASHLHTSARRILAHYFESPPFRRILLHNIIRSALHYMCCITSILQNQSACDTFFRILRWRIHCKCIQIAFVYILQHGSAAHSEAS